MEQVFQNKKFLCFPLIMSNFVKYSVFKVISCYHTLLLCFLEIFFSMLKCSILTLLFMPENMCVHCHEKSRFPKEWRRYLEEWTHCLSLFSGRHELTLFYIFSWSSCPTCCRCCPCCCCSPNECQSNGGPFGRSTWWSSWWCFGRSTWKCSCRVCSTS